MSKIRVLSDYIANQIAAGEVVERPASVAKELVENAIDAGARRIEVDVEAGGRRLLRVADDGEGMTRDDAVLAFERHATSKISSTDDLARLSTLGFRGEALASIASVSRIELITQLEGEAEGTRVLIEGGRMRDVLPAARPRGTTVSVRDLFFNVPARRKFLRSEATESYHLTNFVTHYALAHPEIEFGLTNNGREALRAPRAADVRERAYQLFGPDFLDNLLEVRGDHGQMAAAAVVRGYISAPRERRTTRDAQYLFVNGRFVRDRLIGRALGEGFRTVLPQGVYPAALLFLEVPLGEVDVNVHPAKTEVRFRRAAAVSDAVREAIRAALTAGGYVRAAAESVKEIGGVESGGDSVSGERRDGSTPALSESSQPAAGVGFRGAEFKRGGGDSRGQTQPGSEREQQGIDFGGALPQPSLPPSEADEIMTLSSVPATSLPQSATPAADGDALGPHEAGAAVGPRDVQRPFGADEAAGASSSDRYDAAVPREPHEAATTTAPEPAASRVASQLPPLASASGLVREARAASLSGNIRPLGQFADSFIVAADAEGLLLVDQQAAHERILFDKYQQLERERPADSQQLLVPETFDLTPAQAAAFALFARELETYGFALMRLSGRTVAIKAVPADLPANEARNLLAEILDTLDVTKRGAVRETLRGQIALSLAGRAAIKSGTPLAPEKMQWLIDRLLLTTSPTTCPRGRPIILRLATYDLEKSFRRA